MGDRVADAVLQPAGQSRCVFGARAVGRQNTDDELTMDVALAQVEHRAVAVVRRIRLRQAQRRRVPLHPTRRQVQREDAVRVLEPWTFVGGAGDRFTGRGVERGGRRHGGCGQEGGEGDGDDHSGAPGVD